MRGNRTPTGFTRPCLANKSDKASIQLHSVAEAGGFEPPRPVKGELFSRQPVSATHPRFRKSSINILQSLKMLTNYFIIFKFFNAKIPLELFVTVKPHVDSFIKGLSTPLEFITLYAE